MIFRKNVLAKKLIAGAICVAIGVISASAVETETAETLPAADTSVITAGVLSSTVQGSAGQARTSEQMTAAENRVTNAIVEEALANQAANTHSPNFIRQVVFSTSNTATAAIKASGQNLGTFRLSFYCPCEQCCGKSDGITKTGTLATEGRTIAVDPNVIPLGSHVFIEGYGDFIAEDIGGAIKSNRIDVFLNSHSRCYDLGIAYATVYLM